MALTTKITNAAASAACDAITALLNNGFLDIYDSTGGTGQPATADTAIGSQVLLAHLPLSATAFAGAVNGQATANAITSDTSANADGTATWFRATTSGGTGVIDGSVGTSGANLNLNSVAISSGATVAVSSWTHTVGKVE